MEKYEKYSKLGSPVFDGLNYAFWRIRIKLFLQSLGLDVWKVVVTGYTPLERDPPTGTAERILFECNSRTMCVILGGLAGSKFVKVMYCTFAKEIYDKLKNVYEGNSRVKGPKMKTYRRHFEYLK